MNRSSPHRRGFGCPCPIPALHSAVVATAIEEDYP